MYHTDMHADTCTCTLTNFMHTCTCIHVHILHIQIHQDIVERDLRDETRESNPQTGDEQHQPNVGLLHQTEAL